MFIDDEEVIKSVQRVFEIFEWFDRVRKPARATTVARSLGYPVSSSTALLKSMSERGYLAFDPIRQDYFPTLQLPHNASWMNQAWYEAARLRGLVRDLHKATGRVVTLSYQNDLEMVIEAADPSQSVPAPVTSNIKALLFRSAVGFAALSCRSDRDVAKLMDRYNRCGFRAAGKAEPNDILANIVTARVRGYFVGHELRLPNWSAIAWPLPAPKAGPIVVVAVGGTPDNLRAEENVILTEGRLAIRRAFGGQAVH